MKVLFIITNRNIGKENIELYKYGKFILFKTRFDERNGKRKVLVTRKHNSRSMINRLAQINSDLKYNYNTSI